MLVLPIINRNRIMNVEIKLKSAQKVKQNVRYDDIKPSDIIIKGINYQDSIYNEANTKLEDITEFIRNNNVISKSDYFVSTKEYSNSDNYDIYQVVNPSKKITKELDRLYASVILDMKNEIPNIKKSRYIDFKKLGIADNITEERLIKLKEVATTTNRNYRKTLEENELLDLIELLEFLNLFECHVIESSSIKLEDFEKMLDVFNKINTRDTKSLNNYYNIALNNKKIYSLISKLYNIVYNDSMNWIHSSNKVKTKISSEGKVA